MNTASTSFVNREKELTPVLKAAEMLQDEQQLFRTPLIEFSGVQGIGKSRLLHKIKEIFDERHIESMLKDAKHILDQDFKHIALQLKTGPFALIIDALDTANSDQLQIIEKELSSLIESNRLFVVLASKYVQRFERTRSIARKLKVFRLEVLKQDSCVSYFDSFDAQIPSSTRDIIFEWTRGYPLAMQVMTETILRERLDPTKDENHSKLINILMQEVIQKKLLASASSASEQTRLQILLALLSVPRRFNLILTQDLIEQFAPRYKLVNSLAYITLPKDINDVTNVLSWSLERAGYCIDEPIRNLFLLQYKIEDRRKLCKIHVFLARKNRDFARKVHGSDRIRYIREFFYHLACSRSEIKVQDTIEKRIKQVMQEALAPEEQNVLQSYETLVQFYEEFQLDQELQEVLGHQNTNFLRLYFSRSFLEIYKLLPEDVRGEYLRGFFFIIMQQPVDGNFAVIFEAGMRQLITQATKDEVITFYDEFIQDNVLETLLGENFHETDEHIRVMLHDAG